MNARSQELAVKLRNGLSRSSRRLVLAESCTAGRIAASLAAIPGISQWFCGSFVVYRNDSKSRWLGIDPALLADPQVGPVSQAVTTLLAKSALDRTPEADVALAITGDLGPNAPATTDGVIFLAAVDRHACKEQRIVLSNPAPVSEHDVVARVARLEEATNHALSFVTKLLDRGGNA